MKTNTKTTTAPLSKDQALKKYDKATRLRWRSPISEWRDAFPTVESLAEFRRDVGHISWPENYGQSCWDDAFSLAYNLGEGLSESSRAFLLENADTVTGNQVLAVYAEYGLKVEPSPAPVAAPVAESSPLVPLSAPVGVTGSTLPDSPLLTLDFAYPSSDSAKRFGFYDAGCWVVGTFDGANPSKDKKGFPTKADAIAYGNSLGIAWHPLWIVHHLELAPSPASPVKDTPAGAASLVEQYNAESLRVKGVNAAGTASVEGGKFRVKTPTSPEGYLFTKAHFKREIETLKARSDAPASPVDSVGVPERSFPPLIMLTAACEDLSDTYKAITEFGGPEVSIGQFLRLQEYENAVKSGDASYAANLAKIKALEEAGRNVVLCMEARDGDSLANAVQDLEAALALPTA